MPAKKCLVKSCAPKDCVAPYFRIPFEIVDQSVLKIWLDNVDKERKVIDDPRYGICKRHFSGTIFTYTFFSPPMTCLKTFLCFKIPLTHFIFGPIFFHIGVILKPCGPIFGHF